ncbi:hypothetical protein E2C01_008044 [Portunus trituberculatus]|uniref:Uncharacterized protein n=1 Tax=Portunus trituberculatus TaxID=210409 RepID=A0A5B7CZR1_PORTR|nr:hypothetical protein [Portunus trituberculatus]
MVGDGHPHDVWCKKQDTHQQFHRLPKDNERVSCCTVELPDAPSSSIVLIGSMCLSFDYLAMPQEKANSNSNLNHRGHQAWALAT